MDKVNEMNVKESDPEFVFSCWNEAIHLYAEYNKFERNISQAPWNEKFFSKMEQDVIDKTSLTLSSISIQEELYKIVEPLFLNQDKTEFDLHIAKDKELNMHCGGREDVDVRMIGRPGRPFQIQISNMDKYPSITEINDKFQQFNASNKMMKFFHFKYATKDIIKYIHQCQENKFKI